MTTTDVKWDRRFLELAKLVSSWSKDPSTQSGAAIVRPDRTVVSIGYNGFPKQMGDSAERYANREEKYSRIVHCEINALVLGRQSVEGCTLYTYPFMPCDRCCVQMIQAGIVRMVAPVAPAATLVRWGAAFDKVRSYCAEAGVELVELECLLAA